MDTVTLLNKEFKVLKLKVETRGGGIEIDLTPIGLEGERMAAYQNYLGGGILGRVCVNNTINAVGNYLEEDDQNELDELGEQLKQYFHSLTNPMGDPWATDTYEQNQSKPTSAY